MEVSLVYPHQLFLPHPALSEERHVFVVEEPLFFGNDPQWPMACHKQKLVLHRASISAYIQELRDAGYEVTRVENPEGANTGSTALLGQSLPRSVSAMHLADPEDDVLTRRLKKFAKARDVPLVIHPSTNFLTPAPFLAKHLAGDRKPFMARFYQAQRIRMDVLLEDGASPAGGRWSFDEENRKRLPKGHVPPKEPAAGPDGHVAEAIEWVALRYPDNPGRAAPFRWPVTRGAAEDWFEKFLHERLGDFGAFEDAISTGHAFLNHGALTPMLNIGLLDPETIVARAISYSSRSGKIPLNSLEGFVRQVIGWREFIRGAYIHHGIAMRNGNFWGFTRRLPKSFYDGSTGIAPVDRVIRQLKQEGWCHHIERLMVLGNFMLLCRIHPDDVYRWFMEMFIDSYDWVMVPNVYGMSQFADGGIFATKPYISGSNYIRKMSDEAKGGWCEVWDALFWTFIGDYEPFFADNPRLSMMSRTWAKLGATKQEHHRAVARRFLATLE